METILLKAYAKLNLCLNITKIRQDGYHELDSVFQSIGLFDLLTLKKADGITIICDAPNVPLDENNTCHKAAKAIMQKTGIKGVSIDIKKRIPSEAGLGGGSANAAAVIAGLNSLYQCGLSDKTMMEMGVKIGADVAFFILGGCMRAQGIGQKLNQVENPFNHDIVVIKPKGGVSTPKSYQLFDAIGKLGGSAEGMLSAMRNKDEKAYLANIKNTLEICAFKLAPDSQKAVSALKAAGAKAAMVTGSGSAVFGLFDENTAGLAVSKLQKDIFEHIYMTHKTNKGIKQMAQA